MPKHFLNRVHKPNFEYKNYFYYTKIIIILLYSQNYYKQLLHIAKNNNKHDGMVILLAIWQKGKNLDTVSQ